MMMIMMVSPLTPYVWSQEDIFLRKSSACMHLFQNFRCEAWLWCLCFILFFFLLSPLLFLNDLTPLLSPHFFSTLHTDRHVCLLSLMLENATILYFSLSLFLCLCSLLHLCCLVNFEIFSWHALHSHKQLPRTSKYSSRSLVRSFSLLSEHIARNCLNDPLLKASLAMHWISGL